MKLKPINAVFTAVLLIAPAAFAQESGQSQSTTPSDQSQQTQTTPPEQQGATGQMGGQAGSQQQGQTGQQPGQTGAEQQGQTTQQPGQAGGGTASSQQPGAQGAGAPSGAQGNVITGTVTNYSPGQSITIRESNGQTRQINLGANANVPQNIKTGSRVRVTESNVNGQPMVRVEPISGGRHHGGAAGAGAGTSGAQGTAGAQGAGAQRLPQTASNYPLVGMFGLLSLAAAAGIRLVNRKLA